MEELATEFNGLLAHHLECGQYFDIDVTTAKNPKCFHISLANGKLNKNPDAIVGLNVVVHLDTNEISATSQWKEEESVTQFDRSEIAKGDIKISVMICNNCFQISLNGEHKLQMPYRGQIHHLKAIHIGGDVKLITRVDHRRIYPKMWPPTSYVHYFPTALAFSNDIPIQFQPGHLMVITGRCYGQATGDFFINFRHGHCETQVMHLNVIFPSKTVARHSCIPNNSHFFAHNYTHYENHGGFPFDFNKSFKLGIACKKNEFVMAVNGQFLCSYAYRDPDNIHPNGTGPKPYTSVLSNMVGMKVFQRTGAGVKFTDVDYILLDNPDCINFEKYTQTECDCSATNQCSK